MSRVRKENGAEDAVERATELHGVGGGNGEGVLVNTIE